MRHPHVLSTKDATGSLEETKFNWLDKVQRLQIKSKVVFYLVKTFLIFLKVW